MPYVPVAHRKLGPPLPTRRASDTARRTAPDPLDGLSVCFFSVQYYAFGGVVNGGGVDQALLTTYSFATKAWSLLAPPASPSARSGTADARLRRLPLRGF